MADPAKPQSTGGQARLIAILFVAIGGVLALAYFALLRTDYVPLYRDLRPGDASAIVTELDRRGIAYQLRDGGATILVAESESDEVRLAIAGSQLPLGGLVGFELFNDSDLGLTDFTQKINYQRALQGELARTIMLMDGVENARVHLAIPERSLFRGNRSEPRAAVTVVPRRGEILDEARVAGIRRLVASSVPELALANVAVLDGAGRVISSALASDGNLPPEMEERASVQSYYRARIRAALEPILPSYRFDVRVAVMSAADPAAADLAEAATPTPPTVTNAGGAAQAPTAGARRQFRLRVTLITSEPVDPEQQAMVAGAVRGAADLDEPAGDRLVFAVGAVDLAPVPAAPPVSVRAAAAEPVNAIAPVAARSWLAANAWALIAAGCAALALGLFLHARRSRLAPTERDSFAERLRVQLAAQTGQRSA